MAGGPSEAVLHKHLEVLFSAGAIGGLGDGPLLERFLQRRDEAAFASLVDRHGPMVFRVCRAILRDAHDAEDASQAVFLILARRAGAVRRRDSLASWLFGVACRVSTRAKREAARRRLRERQGAERAARIQPDGSSRVDEDRAELYAQLERLPEPLRAAVVICDLQGFTHEQAARQLRGSVRTVQRRLEQARRRLRQRLGGEVPGALLLPGTDTAARLATPWAATLARAAVRFASSSQGAAGIVPVAALALADGVLTTMILDTFQLTSLAGFATGLVAVVLAAQVNRAAPPAAPAPVPAAVAAPPVEKARELAHDDGKATGKKSIAGSAHAVRFESPGPGWKLTSVRLHGARYGYPQAPDEDLTVSLCDNDFHEIAVFPFPYSTFRRGPSRWVTLDVKPTEVPARFFVCVGFNPTATKGVYVSHDASGGGTSMTGLPGNKPRPFAQGDWMIRARVEPPGEAGKTAPKSD